MSDTDIGNEQIKSIYYLDAEAVNAALANANMTHINENDIIYLNGIFIVYYPKTGWDINNNYYVLNNTSDYNNIERKGISDVINFWSEGAKKDFIARFDIPVPFKSIIFNANIETRTDKNFLIDSRFVSEGKANTPVSVRFPKTKFYQSKTYSLYQSFIINTYAPHIKNETRDSSQNGSSEYIQNRSYFMPIGGMKFVGLYKTDNPPPDVIITNDEIKSDLESNNQVSGIIAADDRGNEKFNVLDGIPTTEDLYCHVTGKEYLTAYHFKKITGSKKYKFKVNKIYHLKWSVLEGGHDDPKLVHYERSVNVSKDVEVIKPYGYWIIDSLQVFAIKEARVYNYALPDGSISLKPMNYKAPDVDYTHSTEEKNHIIEPEIKTSNITLESSILMGDGAEPHIPDENFTKAVSEQIDEIEVMNDKLIFNGTTIISDEKVLIEGPKPIPIPVCSTLAGKDTLYKSGLKIDAEKKNGIHESTGVLEYEKIVNINSSSSNLKQYTIPDLNSVTIHTPVVCDGKIEDKKAFNQMVTPDQSMASLILDMNFNLKFPTLGEHKYILGYGYRDYDKYTASREVKFPFDVYSGNQYYKENTWITISKEVTEFYIPTWVREDKYKILLRSISINAAANNGISKTEELANQNLENYTATDSIMVEVSGRMYGFNLYDVSDYPLWETVFRTSYTIAHSGINYALGTNNQNGEPTSRDPLYILPLIKGSHPVHKNIGPVGAGYLTRFQLNTIGNLNGENDYIRIIPNFYYIDKKSGDKFPVDIYYNETFDGKKQMLVKAGSDLDKRNKKSLTLGGPFLSVPKDEIKKTAAVKNLSVNEVKSKKRNVYTYTNIMIPESLRTFVGSDENIPKNISSAKAVSSRQKWYGEYYLPSQTYVVKKGYDVLGYAKEKSISFNESFWLKDGYILINFSIETIKNGTYHLSYINAENSPNGYCNMWNLEGYQYTRVDSGGNQFKFINGDYVLYDLDKSARKDYTSGGTH